MFTSSDDAVTDAFCDSMYWTRLGQMPRHFRGNGGSVSDAHVWAIALSGDLVDFTAGKPDAIPDLSQAVVRVQPKAIIPPLIRALCVHVGMPIAVVLLMLLVAYAFVILDPLTTLSRTLWQSSGGPTDEL